MVKCGVRNLGPLIAIHQGASEEDRASHYGCVETCGSIWVCAACASRIAEERRQEIQQLLDAHHQAGGSTYMMTLTIPHRASQPCDALGAIVTKCWQHTKSGKPWRKAKMRYRYLGDVRALEVTHGSNGWHPHLHILIFFKPEATQTDAESFAQWLFERWARSVQKHGYGQCSSDAFTFALVSPGKGAADYVAKWGAACELSKAHINSGKSGRTPFDILEDLRKHGRRDDEELFVEYAFAFKGRRHLTWSTGLREHYGLREGRPDEEIADEVPSGRHHVASIEASLWHEITRQRLGADLLDAFDQGGENAVLQLLRRHEIDCYAVDARLAGGQIMRCFLTTGPSTLAPRYRLVGPPNTLSNTTDNTTAHTATGEGRSPVDA